MEPSARVIADSVSMDGHRLTTMEVVMHRFVLAEFNTHRMFSRNSASSRAIPVAKQIKRVVEDPVYPVAWPKEKPGMQGGEALDEIDEKTAREVWDVARRNAVASAEVMTNLGVHKSVTNRLLEPFMWHTVIVSSTEWDNFWRQRVSPLAQPEIRAAAEAMHDTYEASTPTVLQEGQWHTPLVDADEGLDVDTAKKCSVARVCRVSRENHDTGTVDVEKDLATYAGLVSADPAHASPLEHVATPANRYQEPRGNFYGWYQLRHLVLGF